MRKFKNEIDILKCMEDGHINIFTLYGHCEDGSKYDLMDIVFWINDKIYKMTLFQR